MSKTNLEKFSQYAKKVYLEQKEPTQIIGRGEYKVCFGYNSFVALVEQPPKISEEGIFNWIQSKNIKAQNTLSLYNLGIPTPRCLGYIISKDNTKFVELQEKAPGSIMCFTNIHNAIEQILGIPFFKQNLPHMTYEENVKLETEIGKYNIKMQKLLKNAPDYQWIDFIKNYKKILDLGIALDNHGGNFFYDIDKGFTFIDLADCKTTPLQETSYQNVYKLIKKLLNDFTKYNTYMPKRYQEILNKNYEELSNRLKIYVHTIVETEKKDTI